MKQSAALAMIVALTACAIEPAEVSDLRGRWTWPGNDCATANFEFTDDSIILQAADGRRAPLFKILPGKSRAEAPDELVLHLMRLAHQSLSGVERKMIAQGSGQLAVLVRVEGDQIRPLIKVSDDGGRVLREDDYDYKLFNVSRCA